MKHQALKIVGALALFVIILALLTVIFIADDATIIGYALNALEFPALGIIGLLFGGGATKLLSRQ